MAMHVGLEQAKRTLNHAKKFIENHKTTVAELTKGAEAFGAPLLVGLAEGRLANDGSGHIAIAGVPVTLGLGGLALLGAASGYLDEYGVHAGNMAAGLLGSYGGDVGRQMGLAMRAKAGQPIQTALLSPAKLDEVKAALAKKSLALKEAPVAGARVGWQDRFTGEFAVGATPAPLSEQQLVEMVQSASAAP